MWPFDDEPRHYINKETLDFLKRWRALTGINEGEIMRRALNVYNFVLKCRELNKSVRFYVKIDDGKIKEIKIL